MTPWLLRRQRRFSQLQQRRCAAVAAMRARLPAGLPWQPLLEKELARSGAVALFLGQRIGSWHHRELQLAFKDQDFRR